MVKFQFRTIAVLPVLALLAGACKEDPKTSGNANTPPFFDPAAPGAPDESPITPAAKKKVQMNLVTYNVWGLPWPLTVRKERFPYISRAMIEAGISRDVAVVQFQETFTRPAREMVESLWTVPNPTWGPPAKFPKTSGGLASAFRWKVITSFQKAFSACKGSDCLSRKGALFTRVEIPHPISETGQEVWFINTHLNSEGDDSLRQKQLKQVFGWMDAAGIGADDAIVFTGDFNYIAESFVHTWMVKEKGFTDAWDESALRYIQQGQFPPLAFTFDPFNNPNAARSEKIPQRLDYVYYRSSPTVQLKMQTIRIAMTDRVLEDAQLSDHYALETQFQIEY
ncbi:MAG: endonuclease/exonuclease/phosphatase family protein [Bdellovibrionales bacterium]|nr:endonuclease/exonuclease/phosphatase family protein [Bdellovibrionales bacterium]